MSPRNKPPPEPGVGKAVVESFRFHGRIYELRRNSCGKSNCTVCDGNRPAHGPYWYVCISRRGRWRRVYIGKELDTSKFVNAAGVLEVPLAKDRPRAPCPTPTEVVDEPGQELLFENNPDPPDRFWACPKCPGTFSLTATSTAALVNLLLRRHRCPFCQAAVDVSSIAALDTPAVGRLAPPGDRQAAAAPAPTVPVLFRPPRLPIVPGTAHGDDDPSKPHPAPLTPMPPYNPRTGA